MDNFRNLQVWCDAEEKDPTSAFVKYDTLLEEYERKKSGDRPGWLDEIDRFWKVQAAGGDPIQYWLNQPLQFYEPPAIVVRRFWRGIIKVIKNNSVILIFILIFICSKYIIKSKINGANEKTNEPRVPDKVLLGLNLVNFFPPIDLPIT